MENTPSLMSLFKMKKPFLGHPSRCAVLPYGPEECYMTTPKAIPGEENELMLMADTNPFSPSERHSFRAGGPNSGL